MTPDQLASVNAEHSHQRAFFAWCNIAERFGFDIAWDEGTYAPGAMKMVMEGHHATLCNGGYDPSVPELRWLHAIPNGGYRDAITAGKLKAEGVKRGVSDIFLPLPMPAYGTEPARYMRLEYAGLYIEMKRPRVEKEGKRKSKIIAQAEGQLSDEQTEFVGYARNIGYAVAVCFDWRAAAQQVQSYIEAVRNNR